MPRDAWEKQGLDTLYWRELAKYGRARQLAVQRRLALAEQSAVYLTSLIALGQTTWLFGDARNEVRPDGAWLRMVIHGSDTGDLFVEVKLDGDEITSAQVFTAGAGVIEQAARERIVIADGLRQVEPEELLWDGGKLREVLAQCELQDLPERGQKPENGAETEVSLEIVVPGAHRLVAFDLGIQEDGLKHYRDLVFLLTAPNNQAE
jgi:hypothetical protein